MVYVKDSSSISLIKDNFECSDKLKTELTHSITNADKYITNMTKYVTDTGYFSKFQCLYYLCKLYSMLIEGTDAETIAKELKKQLQFSIFDLRLK